MGVSRISEVSETAGSYQPREKSFGWETKPTFRVHQRLEGSTPRLVFAQTCRLSPKGWNMDGTCICIYIHIYIHIFLSIYLMFYKNIYIYIYTYIHVHIRIYLLFFGYRMMFTGFPFLIWFKVGGRPCAWSSEIRRLMQGPLLLSGLDQMMQSIASRAPKTT